MPLLHTMQTALKRLHPALVLLITAILAYGLLIPSLGFYWDDLPMSWIRYQLGPEAMAHYFSTNRPVWGWLYQITTRLIPQVPLYWQIFALFWRWLGAVVVWALVRQLWRDRLAFALGTGLLFLLYPGFNQQWGAYLYSHFFIVLFFFLLSLYLMLRRRTVAALIFSALSLWMMEYFFMLELARLGVIWTALRDEYPGPRRRLRPALKMWSPYLILFILAVLYRIFIFNNQIYGFGLMSQLKADFPGTLVALSQNIAVSLWTVLPAAWLQAFSGPDPSVHGTRTVLLYAGVMLAVFVTALLFLWANRDKEGGMRRDAWYAIGLGLFMLPFAGAPFWLIDLPITLNHPASRFTLPSMLGASLIVAGLLELLRFEGWRYLLVALLVALAAGRQLLWSTDYKREWETQENLFWQMTWRAPGLEPGTTVLLNDRANMARLVDNRPSLVDERVLNFYADNSLAAALNWIYAPDNHSNRVSYVLFYPKSRIGGTLPAFEKDLPITYDLLAGTFEGSTSQVVAFYYAPPGCLRLLDPDVDGINRFMPAESLMQDAAPLSSSAWIQPEGSARMPQVYGTEPAHAWCYYFERADLARQQGNWNQVADLGEAAFGLDDHPNDPVERFVYIEGYAHTGDWNRAVALSKESFKVSKEYVGPMLCRLWKRIEAQTSESPDRSAALSEVKNLFVCYGE